MFEEHCVTDSTQPGFHDVDVETLVMLHCHPNVKTGVRMNVPGSSALGFDWAITAHPRGANGHFNK